MTDFRAEGTIMGLAGLTAVFGMGTGVTPPVWSPEKRPPGGQAGAVAVGWFASYQPGGRPHTTHWKWKWHSHSQNSYSSDHSPIDCSFARSSRMAPIRGEPIGVVKLLGC